jgi:hypothetical protein
LEFAGVDEDDRIHWTEVDYSDPAHPVLGGGASTMQIGYRVAAVLRSGLIAGVYHLGVDWLRPRAWRSSISSLFSARILPDR